MSGSYRGGKAKLYQEAAWADGADVPATPSWTEIKRAIDVSVAGSKGEVDVSSRESDYVLRKGGMLDLQLTFGYRLRHLADAIYDAFVTKWISDAPLLVAVMSTAIATSGSKGWRMPVVVMNVPEEQPLTDSATSNIVMSPADARDSSGDLIEPVRLVTA